ncbi:fungal-specific transcription factor domain-containing protein [Halteromyces radiatus]|uniref:fungal-specific transcription factor domain-containing protein n=1 Tax=Halteromyces radiatus TaxID=101107 RepID=UPI002220B56A|nr:fungal-specific transcription factor domain-containing protein [Halteromyces radiatus]KAI8088657.1 fungal-specific transcription factor domain-containing protein [Halteromyces radiatus]
MKSLKEQHSFQVPLLSRPINSNTTSFILPSSTQQGSFKRHRTERACDTCRRRKVRCDIPEAGLACKQCLRNNGVCIFTSTPRKRGPRNVAILEERLQRMERLIISYQQQQVQQQEQNSKQHDKQKNTTSKTSMDLMRQYLIHVGRLQPEEPINGINDWIYRVAGIDKQTSDELMKVYFAYVFPVFPVINKARFLQEYRHQVSLFPSPPLLCAMYGAAVRYIESCKAFRADDLPLPLIDAANQRSSESWAQLHMKYVKASRGASLSVVQSLIICMQHRSSTNHQWSKVWLLNSMAIRMAQDIGLHRNTQDWALSDGDRETRRRTWSLLYILDRWFSAGAGRPLTVFDEDCDQTYSETFDFAEFLDDPHYFTNNTSSLLQEPRFPSCIPWRNSFEMIKCPKLPIFESLIQVAKLSKIVGNIIQGLYTPMGRKKCLETGSNEIVTVLEHSLTEWRANLPSFLQVVGIPMVQSHPSYNDDSMMVLSGFLGMSYYTALILLHRVFILSKNPTASSQLSLQICTNAAIRCVDLARKIQTRDFILVSWGFTIYPLFIASLIHVYNASSGDSMVADVAKANLLRVLAILQLYGKLSPLAESLYATLSCVAQHHCHLSSQSTTVSYLHQYHNNTNGTTTFLNNNDDNGDNSNVFSTTSSESSPTISRTHYSQSMIEWLENVCAPIPDTNYESTDAFGFQSFVHFGVPKCPYHSSTLDQQPTISVLSSCKGNNRKYDDNEMIDSKTTPPYADFLLYGDNLSDNTSSTTTATSPLSSSNEYYPGDVFWQIPSGVELSEWPSFPVQVETV